MVVPAMLAGDPEPFGDVLKFCNRIVTVEPLFMVRVLLKFTWVSEPKRGLVLLAMVLLPQRTRS